MWSSRLIKIRRLARFAALLPIASLGGCITIAPLYGTWDGGGSPLAAKLQAIEIDPISGRLGHYLGDDLLLALNGTGAQPPAKYHLVVTLVETSQSALIDTVTGIPTGSAVITTADFRLVPVAGVEPIFKGRAFVAASYDRSLARYADVRAARDAEIRDARTLAEQIRTQVAAELATRT